MIRKGRWAFALCTTILAIWIINSGLTSEPLWIDEVISLEQVKAGLWDAIHSMAFADVHPPGFRFLLGIWSSLGGDTAEVLRGFSVLAAALCVWVVAWSSPGFPALPLGAVFLASHAGFIHYGQELRVYAWLCLWILVLLASLRALLLKPGISRCISLSLVMVLGVWCHYIAWVYIGGALVGLALCTSLDETRLKWAGASASLSAAAFALWAPVFLHQTFGLPEGFFAHLKDGPGFISFARTLGPWGGLDSEALVIGGFLSLSALILWMSFTRCRAELIEMETIDGAIEGPPKSLEMGALVSVALTVAIVPILIPRSPLQEELLAKMILPGFALSIILVMGLGRGPLLLARFLRPYSSFLRPSTLVGGGSVPSLVRLASALLFGCVLSLSLAMATGRVGVARNLLPLLPLAAVIFSPLLSTGKRRERLVLLGMVILLLPMPFSVANQADYIHPRPAFVSALEGAKSRDVQGIVVQSPFDTPAVKYSAMELALPEGFVVRGGTPLVIPQNHGLFLTRFWCERAQRGELKAFQSSGEVLQISEIQPLRGMCVAYPYANSRP